MSTIDDKRNCCDSRPPMFVVLLTWAVFFALGYSVRSKRQDEYDCAKKMCPSGAKPQLIAKGCIGDVCICPISAQEKP